MTRRSRGGIAVVVLAAAVGVAGTLVLVLVFFTAVLSQWDIGRTCRAMRWQAFRGAVTLPAIITVVAAVWAALLGMTTRRLAAMLLVGVALFCLLVAGMRFKAGNDSLSRCHVAAAGAP